MEQPRMYTRQWLADHYGVSRKTLSKWIGRPLAFEIGITRYDFNDKTGKGHIFQARLITPKQLKQITNELGMPESLAKELQGKKQIQREDYLKE
jgi:hypothetical protein